MFIYVTMADQILTIITEPAYAKTRWCEDVLEAARKEARRCGIDLNLTAPPSNSEEWVLLLGTYRNWAQQQAAHYAAAGKRILLMGLSAEGFSPYVSSVAPNRSSATERMVQYFVSAGKMRIALFGINPAAWPDQRRRAAFEQACARLGVADYATFENNGDLQQCIDRFLADRSRFDAVLCNNDTLAVQLIHRLKAQGVRLPEELFVAGNGNTEIGRRMAPSLTSVSLCNSEVGRQAVRAWRFLRRQPKEQRLCLEVEGEIIARASTGFFEVQTESLKPEPSAGRDLFFTEPPVDEFFRVEAVLAGCDDLDLSILRGLADGARYEELSEALFISVNTLKYRLKKIMAAARVHDRRELAELMMKYEIKL
ncbi:MAG: substrate-binding domain-containing protein [Clostridia bacterium]|nr:substrate-binding domain-containing protein [Clostridia bacterium]